MKKRVIVTEIQDNFVRGFVSTGLLAGFQGSGKKRRARSNARRFLRLALQGGTALSAGSATLEALRRNSLSGVLGAIAAGSAALMVIEHLLHDEITQGEIA